MTKDKLKKAVATRQKIEALLPFQNPKLGKKQEALNLAKLGKLEIEEIGQIIPVLYLTAEKSKKPIAVKFENGIPDGEEKRLMFSKLGFDIKAQYGKIKEAYFMTESFFIKVESKADQKVMPSQHPKRQEAINIIYRNHQDKTRLVHQIFKKTKKAIKFNKPEASTTIEDNLLIHLFKPEIAVKDMIFKLMENKEIKPKDLKIGQKENFLLNNDKEIIN